MVQRLPTAYLFDPDDPRAPSVDQWAQMPLDERARVVAMLPTHVPLGVLAKERHEEERHIRMEVERQLVEARAAIGRAKSAAILAVLAARGIEVSAAARARIEAQGDTSALDHWIVRAATATSADEVLAAG